MSIETSEPTMFGSGFASGIVSAVLGLAALGAVLCFRFPNVLTYADLRAYYAVPTLRAILHLALVASFLLGSVSACLRRNKMLAFVGIGSTLAAALLGGSQVPIEGEIRGRAPFGLDFFVLNLMLYAAVFIPLERLFALRPEQPVFRADWPVDLVYFFVNSLLIEILTIATLLPALVLFTWARVPAVAGAIGALPLLVQVPLVVLVADFTQYWVHRVFHAVPALWRFHAIHHSAERMDWLAGSRLHLVDVVVTRGLSYVPIFVLGFSNAALYVYVFLVAAQATFIHANVRWPLRPIRRIVATPAFHHWHHSADVEAVDKNFAVHTPLWDWLFGTFHLPDRWPASYGLSGGRPVPSGFLRQLLHPFRRS
jgi:sterol desaturase/sphingolipid hydroxylase (fatty acid hydroxylase superfamily)